MQLQFQGEYIFTLKMATAMFAEALDVVTILSPITL
jgi:hypothetical protein